MEKTSHQNEIKAQFALCLKRAENGHDEAQCQLGVLYGYGHGAVPRDWTKALIWWERAAHQGNPAAQAALGYCWARGYGTKGGRIDHDRAVFWYRKAVAGHKPYAHAQFRLGECYEQGQGVVQNHKEAMVWFTLAAGQGHREAKAKLRRAVKEERRRTSGFMKDSNAPIKIKDSTPIEATTNNSCRCSNYDHCHDVSDGQTVTSTSDTDEDESSVVNDENAVPGSDQSMVTAFCYSYL